MDETTPSPFDVPDPGPPDYATNSVAGLPEVPDCDIVTGLNPLVNMPPTYAELLAIANTPDGFVLFDLGLGGDPIPGVTHASRRLDGRGSYYLVARVVDEENRVYYGPEDQSRRTIGGDAR